MILRMLRRVWTWFHHSDLENARHTNIMLGEKMRQLEAVALELALEVYDLGKPDAEFYQKMKDLWIEDSEMICQPFPIIAIGAGDVRWESSLFSVTLLALLEDRGMIKRKTSATQTITKKDAESIGWNSGDTQTPGSCGAMQQRSMILSVLIDIRALLDELTPIH